jgi:predicted CoA-binding protein
VPVNPKLGTLDGQTCYPNLSAIPKPVDGIVIVIPPSKVGPVLREAAELGIRHVWLQPGAGSEEVIALGGKLGLELVHSGPCVMVEAQRLWRVTA